jgi:hypothetical protein
LESRFEIGYLCDFEFGGFGVSPSLLKEHHAFRYQDREVTVWLSNRYNDQHDESKKFDELAKSKAYKWAPVASKAGTRYRAQRIYVGEARIFVSCAKSGQLKFKRGWITIDQNERSAKFYEENSAAMTSGLTAELSTVAHSAFDYWTRVVRWVVRSYLIGEPHLGSRGFHGYEAFAIYPPLSHIPLMGLHLIQIQQAPEIDRRKWNMISALLDGGFEPPIWYDLYCEAARKNVSGDFRGAIIDCAVAVEVIFRQRLDLLLDKMCEPGNGIRKRIVGWQISEIINSSNSISTLLDLALTKSEIDDLKDIMKSRNDLVHRGGPKVEKSTAEKGVHALSTLISRLEKQLAKEKP